VIVTPEDGVALVDAIEALRADASRRAAMSAAGRAYASQHWERTRTLSYLSERLQRIVRPPPTGAVAASAAGTRPNG